MLLHEPHNDRASLINNTVMKSFVTDLYKKEGSDEEKLDLLDEFEDFDSNLVEVESDKEKF